MIIQVRDFSDNDKIAFESSEVPNVGDYIRFDGSNIGNKCRGVVHKEFQVASGKVVMVILYVDIIEKDV